MIFSHISDTHLGMSQYGTDEREEDVYQAFNESIDISIKDHVDFVIFSGDIFHVPNPNGTAIVQMANALKRLRENNIDSFFILGEHDISRIRTTPIHYVYHNLGFSKYIGQGKPILYKDVLLCGFDKIRKSEMQNFEERFKQVNNDAKNHNGHRIMVMHQGITEFNKFAGEMLSTDLPPDFTYYAMGHLHDHEIREFSNLAGPVVYPGSIEMSVNETIKDSKKGFVQVDISRSEAKTNWIKLDTRPQISETITYDELDDTISKITEKIKDFQRKPVVELKIQGEHIETEHIQAQINRLNDMTLRNFWKVISKQEPETSVLLERPNKIDDEMLRLAIKATGSEQTANFAVKQLLPLLSTDQVSEATQVILENFERFREAEKQ